MSRARSVADLGNQNVLDLNATDGTLKVGAGVTIENTGEVQFAGIVTAATVQIGAATTLHSTGLDLGAGNINSHNITSTGNLSVDGNMSVGGVLTYEDVTSVDSVGIVTARSGIDIGTGTSISSPASNELALGTNDVERLRISSTGQVGIGLTDPTAILEAVTSVDGEATLATFKNTSGGGTNETVDIKLGLQNSTASNVILRAGKEGNHSSGAATNNFFAIHTTVNSTSSEKLRITSAGQVGIGTDNPTDHLQILHTNGKGLTFKTTQNHYAQITSDCNRTGADSHLLAIEGHWNGTPVAEIALIAGSDTTNKDNGQIIFRTSANNLNSNERLRITSAGSVGINSTTPYGLFDICGQGAEDNIVNIWSYNKSSRISLWPSDDHVSERWRMAFFENNASGAGSAANDDHPDWCIDGNGRQYMTSNLYIGRTRSFADSPANQYPYFGTSGPAIFITNGVDGDNTNYSASLRVRCYQTDTDDRNIFYYAYTSTTAVLDDDQHQKFGVKGSGRLQGMRSFYCGRVESDETTPNSVYSTSANGVYAYDRSGYGETRMLAHATPATTHYSFYSETGTSEATNDVQFKVRSTDGRIYSDYGASVTSGADYAESFEWHDGNPDNEDRVGYSVVLQDGKIRKVLDSDDTSLIMGIISAAPAVLGDSADLKWQGRYLKDDFGREIMQDVELLVWNHGQFEPQPDINDKFRMEHCDSFCKVSEIDEKLASGEIKQWVVDQNLRITSQERTPNPDYNSSNVYVPRSERPEWDPVGLMGKLWLRPNQPTGDRWVKLRDGANGLTYWLVR